MYLIKDSLVVDGTGAPPVRADVLINGDRISAIGSFSGRGAGGAGGKNIAGDLVIDGVGTVTTPGFIDVNTDSDHYLSLFTDPLQQDFLRQGTTTIIGGHCGSSLAPLLYGTLESVRKWGDINQINVDWNTMGEFLATLKRIKLGVNFGTLIGHSTIRRALIGEQARDLTIRELDVFKEIVTSALKEGALGLSTGLAYSHSKMTPYAEIKMLTDIVAKHGGVYATHLRNEQNDVVQAVKEALSIARDSKVTTIISHFRPMVGFEPQFETALAEIENESESTHVHFDMYPFDYSMLPIYTLLPEWAKIGSLEKMLAQFTENHIEAEILKSLPAFKANDIVIARATGYDFLVGKSLGDFAKGQHLTLKPALIRLMKMTRLRAVLFYKNINLPVAIKAMYASRSLIASNSPSLLEAKNVIENERALKTFSTFLTIVTQEQKKSIEWAVQKITQTPAQIFNLKDRGVIKAGAIADVVMLKNNVPVNVFVAGERALIDGKVQSVRAGTILKR